MESKSARRAPWFRYYALIAYCGLAIGFLFLSNLAYINLALHTKPGSEYTGANPYTAADKLVYMSMVEQGRHGVLFMKNLHTSEPQKGLMVSPHWYVIGSTARLLSISNNASYQAYRILFSVLFLWLLWVFLAHCFVRLRDRIVAAAFVLFSGGLGWVFIIFYPQLIARFNTSLKFIYSPIDLYVTEGNTLANFSQSPLFSLSQLALLLIMYLFIKNRDRRTMLLDFSLAFGAFLLGIMHPYDIPILLAVLGTWSIWYVIERRQRMTLWKFGILVAGLGAALVCNFLIAQAEPVLAEWLKQNLVYSPPFRNYFWGYGLLLPFWAVGLVHILRHKRRDPWWMLLGIWTTIIWVILYFPLIINRRFINGYHIALAIAAAQGFLAVFKMIRSVAIQILYSAATSLIVFSSLGFALLVGVYFSPSVYEHGYYYITPDTRATVEFLRHETSPQDALLTSDMRTSFLITSQIARAVFRGHDHQTPRYLLKQQQLDWFFGDQKTAGALERKADFMRTNNIAYVVLNEKNLERSVFWVDTVPFLERVFTSGDYRVYRVVAQR